MQWACWFLGLSVLLQSACFYYTGVPGPHADKTKTVLTYDDVWGERSREEKLGSDAHYLGMSGAGFICELSSFIIAICLVCKGENLQRGGGTCLEVLTSCLALFSVIFYIYDLYLLWSWSEGKLDFDWSTWVTSIDILLDSVSFVLLVVMACCDCCDDEIPYKRFKY
ncbi:hypothetical protein ElyMa_007055300 [Elysia marginata]|uniref:MARVEL domain-containing protein n=1 Tax=Elysia marginata TaxID=1093978 RepID=A0AAV4JUK1_9GAST|nr:hypothetical protein ElyMa_007055300 [Elysia marginata]